MTDNTVSSAEHPLTHVIVMTVGPGYWGKGETVQEAIKNSQWIGWGDKVRVIKVDEKATVDEMGGLRFFNREHLGVGTVSKNRKEVKNLKQENAS